LGTESTYIFSSNASIVEANYLIHRLGMNLPNDIIDWDSVEDAADIDDQGVTLSSGGSELRYSSALYWATDESHESVLARAGAAHAGGCRPIGRKYVMFTGVFDASNSSLTPDDYAGDGLTVTEKVPLSGRVNGVRGQFTSPLDNYEKRDFPNYQDATALSDDDDHEEWLEVDFDAVTSHTQAQRLARIAYNRARYGYKASLTAKFSQFDVVANDVIDITDELADLSAATFRVQEERLGDEYTIDFEMTYEASSFFSWTAATDEQEYIPSDPVEGETGNIRPPGALLWDNNGGAGIVANFEIWASPSTIAGAEEYRFKDNLGNEKGARPAMSATATLNVNTSSGGASTAGNWTLGVLDADGVILTQVLVNVPSGQTYGNLFDTISSTIRYTLPASPQPTLVSLSSGAASVKIRDVTAVHKATDVRLYRHTSNDFSGASLEGTQAVSGSGNTFNVTGTAGTVEFFWGVIYNSSETREGPESVPILVVF
jgi:hypothetical protein